MPVFRYRGFVYSFGDKNNFGEYVVLKIDQSGEDAIGEVIDARIIKAKNPNACQKYIKKFDWEKFREFPIEQLPENKSFNVQRR